MKYRIVKRGYGVYIDSRPDWWPFWSRSMQTHHASSAYGSSTTIDKNYRTVELAKEEIDRRLAEDARWVPRIIPYP